MPDRLRWWVVAGSAAAMLLGTLHGSWLLGAPVEQAAAGSLSAEASTLGLWASAAVIGALAGVPGLLGLRFGGPARRPLPVHIRR